MASSLSSNGLGPPRIVPQNPDSPLCRQDGTVAGVASKGKRLSIAVHNYRPCSPTPCPGPQPPVPITTQRASTHRFTKRAPHRVREETTPTHEGRPPGTPPTHPFDAVAAVPSPCPSQAALKSNNVGQHVEQREHRRRARAHPTLHCLAARSDCTLQSHGRRQEQSFGAAPAHLGV